MSWQNTWSTMKATNAKACALYHEISNVGKTIEGSKKRVTWRLKVEGGKEYEISLTHSLASGKKVLRVDGIVKYTAKAMSFGDWDYVFNLPGGHVVHIIIKPSVDLNDMYDLIIDGVSFRRLPDRLDPNKKPNPDAQYIYSGERGPRPGVSRENSFTPWECQSCTLVNEKPLAPVCEACGEPKPAYISPASAMRAKAAVEQRAAAPVSRKTQQPQVKQADLLGTDDSTFNPFGNEAASAFSSNSFSTTSAPAPMSTTSSGSATNSFNRSAPAKQEDITSMLSGLDFTSVPTPAPQANQFANFMQGPASPNPADDSTNERTGSGDLWESKMVDLNLKPTQKPKATNVKSGQSLEQARQTSSFTKDKVPVMPLPAPAPVMMTQPMNQGYYATAGVPQQGMGGYYPQQQQHMQQQQAMMMTQPAQYGTVAGYGGGYGGMNMGMGAPVSQQSFMTAAPPQANGGPKKPAFYGADPFATLS